MLEFRNKILFVGYGAVAQCALPILAKHLKMPLQRISVMDFEDRRDVLAPWLKRGVKFVHKRVTRGNMGALLGKYLEAGDVLIDLAWNIDCCEILQWCHDRGVLYINIVGPVRECQGRNAAENDVVLASHEHPPHDFKMGQTRPDGSARTRREPRSHLALHQAGFD